MRTLAKPTGITLLEAVLKECGGLYRIKRLGPDSLVKGQAITYLQKSLRLDGWRSVTYMNLTQLARNNPETLGFNRGRGRRNAHGGKMGWTSDADVFYDVRTLSQCTEEQLIREEADEWQARMF